VTTLFVSHDLGAVRRFCDKTLLLSHGRQVAFGETGEIIDRYVYGGEGRVEEQEAGSEGSGPEGSGPERSGPERSVSDAVEAGGGRKAAQPQAETEASTEDEGPTGPRRWGDGRVVITGVELLDKFGAPGERFSSFDPMTVRIRYLSKEKIADPIFGIALYDEEDRHLYGTNTQLKDHPIEEIEGAGYVDLEVARIPMLSGKFLLTVAAHTREGKPYDWLDKQYSFEVVPAGRDAGIIEVPCRWVR